LCELGGAACGADFAGDTEGLKLRADTGEVVGGTGAVGDAFEDDRLLRGLLVW
jgi:hypothetical protein